MLTATMARGALVNIFTVTAVSAEPVASVTATLISTRRVGTHLLAAWGVRTVINVNAGLPVFVQLIAMRAGAQGACAGVTAAVRAASVASLTAVHDLHLNPVALPAIGTQLIACMAHTLKGSPSVEAAVRTLS